MKNQPIRDERIVQAKQKIHAEILQIVIYIITISFCVKALYFGMDLKQCTTEYIILVFAPLYQFFRSRQLGVVLRAYPRKSTAQHLFVACISLILMFLIFYISGKQVSADFVLPFIVSFSAVFLLVRMGFSRLEEKRAKKLESLYDEEENE